jgi:hypothetical protein
MYCIAGELIILENVTIIWNKLEASDAFFFYRVTKEQRFYTESQLRVGYVCLSSNSSMDMNVMSTNRPIFVKLGVNIV